MNPRNAQSEILNGPIIATMIPLAAPNLVTVLVQSGVTISETWFIGILGTAPLAAVALVFPFMMLMQAMSGGAIGGAVSSSIARALGAGNQERAQALVLHAVAIAVGMGVLFALTIGLFAGALFGVMGGQGLVLEEAILYGRIVFIGAIAIWLSNTLAAIIRGTGNMVFPARVLQAMAFVQVPLSGVLIFGVGPFPELGLQGAAIGFLTTTILATGIFIWRLMRGDFGLQLKFDDLTLRMEMFRDILSVGLLASFATIFNTLTVISITGLVGSYGDAALAGYGLGARLEILMIPVAFSIGMTLTTMVGMNIGAGQIDRAKEIAIKGSILAGASVAGFGVVFAIFPWLWTSMFTTDPAVHAATAAYLNYVGPFYGFLGVGLAMYFASQGAGNMVWPFFAGLLRLTMVAGGGTLIVVYYGGTLTNLFQLLAVAMVLFGSLMFLSVVRSKWKQPEALQRAGPAPALAGATFSAGANKKASDA